MMNVKRRAPAPGAALLASPNPPPRLRLGQLLLGLYTADDEPARALLLEMIPQLPPNAVGWGIWQGIKVFTSKPNSATISPCWAFCAIAWTTKLNWAKETFRAALGCTCVVALGAICGNSVKSCRSCFRCTLAKSCVTTRLSATSATAGSPTRFGDTRDLITGATDQGILGSSGLPTKLEHRAFDDAWKISPAPLLRLLEDAQNSQVCEFAIRGLEQDFKDTLRHVEPAWLARLGAKRLDIVHDFIIKLLRDNPEFHQSKLKQLGLHDMVLGLLYSGITGLLRHRLRPRLRHRPARRRIGQAGAGRRTGRADLCHRPARTTETGRTGLADPAHVIDGASQRRSRQGQIAAEGFAPG
ncbi:MAG: hypothetical protein R3F40_10405 [Candidatus Competibacteraceae bacterium]